MAEFPLHDPDSAPEASRDLLLAAQRDMGMIPNLYRVMAESPQLLTAYQQLQHLFQHTTLTPTEQNVVWLAVNVEHACHYCVPAHTALAHGMKVEPAIIDALRAGQPLADPRLEALRSFTLDLVRNRGVVEDTRVEAFLAAGFTRRQAMEIILGIAQKVLSNYLNHLADTPIDAPFEEFAWQPETGTGPAQAQDRQSG